MKITNIAINDLNPAKYNPRLDLKPDWRSNAKRDL